MTSTILIIGSGFAGIWSALSAQRLINLHDKSNDIKVVVISPEPTLVLRPRLYEADPGAKNFPLQRTFQQAGIQHVPATVTGINTVGQHVTVQASHGNLDSTIPYDRLILAAGSALSRPASIPGIEQHAFDVDCLASAVKLDKHLECLASLPVSPARNTIVICGAGFTGIEVATELPSRLKLARIILIERADSIGAELGPGPRLAIKQALKHLDVETRPGCTVAAIDGSGVTLATGEHISASTVIWTAGPKATSLVQDIPGSKDLHGRLHVDQKLRAPLSPHVFASGDTAHVSTRADGDGPVALMSCQHALYLGRVSGHNAAADLLGEPLVDYVQEGYTCCLDLGGWGAVVSQGWEREVCATGDLAKRMKGYINGTLIYPPVDVDLALKAAKPVVEGSEDLFDRIVAALE